MPQRFIKTRSLFFTAILLIAIIAGIAPVAADSVAYIQVSSIPSGAQACLDHYTCNETPAMFTTTPNSYHSVTLYKDGYLSFTNLSVYASSPNVTTNLLATLASIPSRATLEVARAGLGDHDALVRRASTAIAFRRRMRTEPSRRARSSNAASFCRASE